MLKKFKNLSKSLTKPTNARSLATIVDIKAREIFDSRGNPTVEAEVVTKKGIYRAAVPSGASTGAYEALELRDGDKEHYSGKGVLKAVKNIQTIIKAALVGKDCTDQIAIDKLMVEQLDGSKNEYGWSKSNLGANAILAVSIANTRAGADSSGLPLYKYLANLAGRTTDKFILPVPSFNVINGGKSARNRLAFQDFTTIPTGAYTFREALKLGAEVYNSLKKIIANKYGHDAANVGDSIQDGEEGLNLLQEAIEKAGHNGKVELGIDAAASQFYVGDKKVYDLGFKNSKPDGSTMLSPNQLIDLYLKFANKYPIVSIEDPFDQDDWESFQLLVKKIENKVQIVGDDLLVTNPQRIKIGIEKKAATALLLKVNQIGSVTESIEAANLARKAGWGVMVSHRSGETEDTFIADLVVGLGTGQIKAGALSRSERLAKYNQLLRIEEELGNKAMYAGKEFRFPKDQI